MNASSIFSHLPCPPFHSARSHFKRSKKQASESSAKSSVVPQGSVEAVEWQIQRQEVPALVATMKAFQFIVGLSRQREKATVRKAFSMATEASDSSC